MITNASLSLDSIIFLSLMISFGLTTTIKRFFCFLVYIPVHERFVFPRFNFSNIAFEMSSTLLVTMKTALANLSPPNMLFIILEEMKIVNIAYVVLVGPNIKKPSETIDASKVKIIFEIGNCGKILLIEFANMSVPPEDAPTFKIKPVPVPATVPIKIDAKNISFPTSKKQGNLSKIANQNDIVAVPKVDFLTNLLPFTMKLKIKMGIFNIKTIKLIGISKPNIFFTMFVRIIETPVAPPVTILFGFANHVIAIE